MSLKIVTGKFKGSTLLSTDKVKELRPTQALVREAMINIIRTPFHDRDFEELRGLDLFAGIGTLGFELLSNDFKEVVFVEENIFCLNLIKKNLAKLNLSDKSKVVKAKLPQGLKDVKNICGRLGFDLIFIDPPYKFSSDDFINTISKILENDILNSAALLVLENNQKTLGNTVLERFPEHLELLKEKRYGDTYVFFFERTSSNLK